MPQSMGFKELDTTWKLNNNNNNIVDERAKCGTQDT